MADFRVWYASRDPYHCIFRMVRLMAAKGEPMPLEQLRILDMFLMFPALLHRLSLPANIKERFRALGIPTPANSFVRLPGTASVWQELQLYQTTSLKRLTGLGLLKRDALRDRYASLETTMVPAEIMKQAVGQNVANGALVSFLVHDVGSLPLTGREGLIKRAGLPSRGPIV
ncbi:MAG: ABC-three component system middle component 5 [Brevundimonas sp.]